MNISPLIGHYQLVNHLAMSETMIDIRGYGENVKQSDSSTVALQTLGLALTIAECFLKMSILNWVAIATWDRS